MGNTLHMDTQEIRQLANQLNRGVGILAQDENNLKQSICNLASHWQGPHAANFQYDFQSWLRRYDEHVQRLQ
jgi:WXG100 family type VII secretion target